MTTPSHIESRRGLVVALLDAATAAVIDDDITRAEGWLRGGWRVLGELAALDPGPEPLHRGGEVRRRNTMSRRIFSAHWFVSTPDRPLECRWCGRTDVHPTPKEKS